MQIPGHQLVCPDCDDIVEAIEGSKIAFCNCGSSICTMCGMQDHFGATCKESYDNTKDFQLIELPKPNEQSGAQTKEEERYIEAKLAFDYFIKKGNNRIVKIEYVHNPELTRRYEAKRKEIADRGIDP